MISFDPHRPKPLARTRDEPGFGNRRAAADHWSRRGESRRPASGSHQGAWESVRPRRSLLAECRSMGEARSDAGKPGGERRGRATSDSIEIAEGRLSSET